MKGSDVCNVCAYYVLMLNMYMRNALGCWGKRIGDEYKLNSTQNYIHMCIKYACISNGGVYTHTRDEKRTGENLA